MRDVWKKLDENVKTKILPCKTSVHRMFSTSFGLHVAVITADEPPLFVFTRRAMRGKQLDCRSRDNLLMNLDTGYSFSEMWSGSISVFFFSVHCKQACTL